MMNCLISLINIKKSLRTEYGPTVDLKLFFRDGGNPFWFQSVCQNWSMASASTRIEEPLSPLSFAYGIRIMLATYHFILLKCRNSLKPIRKYIKNHVRKYNVQPKSNFVFTVKGRFIIIININIILFDKRQYIQNL